MIIHGTDVAYTAAMVLLCGVLLLVARHVYSRVAKFDVDHQLTVADNPAVGVSLFGYLGGVVIALVGVVSTDRARSEDSFGALAWDLAETAIYGVIVIILIKLSGWVNDRFVLRGFENDKELVQDRNVGAAACLAGSYLASGLILAGALSGRVATDAAGELSRWELLGHELLIALVFFGLGQLVLILYAQIHQRFTKHDPLRAIAEDYTHRGQRHGGNAAAGLGLAGNLVAVGVVLWGGARGDFIGWGPNLARFGIIAGVGLLALPLWRLFVDAVLLGKADMSHEIYVDRNTNAALLEAVSVVGLAAMIALMLAP